MTVRFTKQGARVAATNIVVDPNVVIKVAGEKTVIGIGQRKKVKKTDGLYVKAAGIMPRFVKEVTSKNPQNIKAGDKLTVSVFEPGDEVKITGTTKGKGFAGGVKRWGFHGGPKTHGQSDRHRAPGSIGAGTTPGRVYKGKHMAGHMGSARITINGLEVIDVDTVNNLLTVKGAVPGARNGFLIIEKVGKVKGYTPPPPPNEEKQAEKEAEAEAEAKSKEAQEEPTQSGVSEPLKEKEAENAE
ncbi:MAG: 50S ribosomal protein L3 [Candidatus Curtissbacteria bacterium GW2011_GWA1_40_16]|uniref:50S ribosomal protein L3 n=1 Tax=Candidatus Curtissbacteria bacterium GW2011_GWA1_40_16 TaxID=1618405 RepID=A0A0G0R7G2_9BACT|nr:MAG: 50S ribosomal protein L3 [Candidatus Curtissbacteria bacterium GW2011_GWA1_40_16]